MFPEIDYSHSNCYIFSYLIHCVIKITNIEGFHFELKTIIGGFYVFFFSEVASWIKNPPAMQEVWVSSLGQVDPLEKGMPTHFSIPAWNFMDREEPGGLQSIGLHRVGHY